MAIKPLATTYLVAESTVGSTENDTDTWYRGWKDFLFWLDTPLPGIVQQVVIKAGNGDGQNAHYLNASLYECTNLLSDPGDQIGDTLKLCTPAGQTIQTPRVLTVRVPRSQGLYRLRVEPDTNQPLFAVEFKSISWYSMECWEPRFNFYMFGVAGESPPGPTTQALSRINCNSCAVVFPLG